MHICTFKILFTFLELEREEEGKREIFIPWLTSPVVATVRAELV